MKLAKKKRQVTKNNIKSEWMAVHIEIKTRRYYERIFAQKYKKLDVTDKFLET